MAEVDVPHETLTLGIEYELPDDVIERFHDLYLEAFGPLAARAVARQVLHRSEFFEEMRDPRVMKYVVRDCLGDVVGLTTLTRDLETVPWISPQYFATQYPEQTARDAVFYLGFSLVAPRRQRSKIFQSMIEAIIVDVGAVLGVCGWDVCAFNEETIGFSHVVEALIQSRLDCTVTQIDAQLYSAAEVHGPLPR